MTWDSIEEEFSPKDMSVSNVLWRGLNHVKKEEFPEMIVVKISTNSTNVSQLEIQNIYLSVYELGKRRTPTAYHSKFYSTKEEPFINIDGQRSLI